MTLVIAHTHIYVHTYIHTYKCAYIYVCMYVYIHIYVCMHVRMHIYIRIYVSIYAYYENASSVFGVLASQQTYHVHVQHSHSLGHVYIRTYVHESLKADTLHK